MVADGAEFVFFYLKTRNNNHVQTGGGEAYVYMYRTLNAYIYRLLRPAGCLRLGPADHYIVDLPPLSMPQRDAIHANYIYNNLVCALFK